MMNYGWIRSKELVHFSRNRNCRSSIPVPRFIVQHSNLASYIGAKCYLDFRRSSCPPRCELLGEFIFTIHKYVFPQSEPDDKDSQLLDIGAVSDAIDALDIFS